MGSVRSLSGSRVTPPQQEPPHRRLTRKEFTMSKFLSQCNSCDKLFPADLTECPKCGNFVDISPASVDQRDWCFDIETFPNCFTCTWIHIETGLEVIHEISDRRNDWEAFTNFVHGLGRAGARGVGFNNLGFDYPVIHWIVSQPGCDVGAIYAYAMSIIRSNDKFGVTIWDNDQIFKQLDLYKICHFDNKARSTSLKALEIVMRSRNVVDLPFPVGTMLNDAQKDVLIDYNRHDVKETIKFYVRCLDQIAFREELTERYQRNFLNHNDTKIGKDYFIMELEKTGVECFTRGPTGRQPRQSPCDSILLGDVIFPYIKFERPEFQRVLDFFRTTTITQTKGVFADLSAMVDGVEYKFGTGGLHSAIDNSCWHSNEEYVIILEDVTSYYPSMAIKNRIYPEHLTEKFCDIYESMFIERRRAKREGQDSIQAMLKLALNGTYGDSNNKYSPFYSPFFCMQITVNGQLMLCMLVEQLLKIPGLVMCQSNTDGIVAYCPRKYEPEFDRICDEWQKLTMLELEKEIATSFFQRDVNNYICVTE